MKNRAFVLFVITKLIHIENEIVYYGVSTIFILGFIVTAYIIEKKHITNEN